MENKTPEADVEVVRLILEMRHNLNDGSLQTSHRPASDTDAEVMGGWPSGGLAQAGHSLFVEMLRHEAYLLALVTISERENGSAEPLDRKDLAERVRLRLLRMTDTFIDAACEEVLVRVGALATPAVSDSA